MFRKIIIRVKLKNTIIYLIGFSGVGKYTIAKELAKLDEFRILHSQLIKGQVFNVLDIDTTNFSAQESACYILNKIKELNECQ